MTHTRLRQILAIASTTILLAACSPSLIVNIRPDGSGSAAFSAEMTATAHTVVKKFTALEEGKSDGKSTPSLEAQLFDPAALTVSLAQAGFSADSIDFPAKGGMALGLTIPNLDGVMAKAVTMKAADRRMSVTLSRESINDAIDLMPAETREYLDLLMAPVFTGENLSLEEYCDIIAAAYGKTLASELKTAAFTLTLRCPAPVKSASVSGPGKAKHLAETAEFTIPLTALLVMENSLTATATW